MYCENCGKKRSESDVFCGGCGKKFASKVEDGDHSNVAVETTPQQAESRDLIRKTIIDGRMARKEFAIITFVPYLIGVLLAIITDATGIDAIYYLVVPVLVLWFLFGYFASIRRLHDINKSAWWLLLIAFAFILMTIKQSLELVGADITNFDLSIVGILFNITGIAGFVMLLALVFAKGSMDENKYGKPVVGRGFSWRGTLLNIYTNNEKLEPTYFYTTAAIFFGIIIVVAAMFLK